jgi:hypothetical protein
MNDEHHLQQPSMTSPPRAFIPSSEEPISWMTSPVSTGSSAPHVATSPTCSHGCQTPRRSPTQPPEELLEALGFWGDVAEREHAAAVHEGIPAAPDQTRPPLRSRSKCPRSPRHAREQDRPPLRTPMRQASAQLRALSQEYRSQTGTAEGRESQKAEIAAISKNIFGNRVPPAFAGLLKSSCSPHSLPVSVQPGVTPMNLDGPSDLVESRSTRPAVIMWL